MEQIAQVSFQIFGNSDHVKSIINRLGVFSFKMPPRSRDGHEAGLLEFLEEVIGSHRYIKTLAKLEQRVETLDHAREEKLVRVGLVENEKNKMMEPVKKVF